MIQKAKFKAGDELEDTRFAPYEGEVVFIIDEDYLIVGDEIVTDFDVQFYKGIFEIIETVY